MPLPNLIVAMYFSGMDGVSSGVPIRARTALTAFALFLSSMIFFLWRLDNPPKLFYDEPQYVSAAKAFLAETPNPNPEAPPMGKLLIAVGIRMLGDNPWGWRSVGAVFGSLSLVGIFLWAQLLLHDYALALTAVLLTLLNNFLYVMSRVAMMDIFLVGFLIWGLVAFTAALDIEHISAIWRRVLLSLSGISFGLACACKWNGVDTLGLTLLASLVLFFFGNWSLDERIKRYGGALQEVGLASVGMALVILPILAYAASYWPLCRSLHKSFSVQELTSMNVFIWRFHRGVEGNPAIASAWYSWLLQFSPQRALSYLVGNWAVMWGGLLAGALCLRRFGKSFPHTLLVLLYVGNLLQWAVTPQRLLYYYYYFPAAMLMGITIALALQDLPERIFGIRPSVICLVAASCVFLFCFPHMAHLESPFDCALGCWV
jgi:dolichyl-phosphate-mannose-protein mannosyltransferase